MHRQLKKEFVLAHPPEEKFREVIEDGTMEHIVDARLNNEKVSLLQMLYPDREEPSPSIIRTSQRKSTVH